jgi:hypothetical protein
MCQPVFSRLLISPTSGVTPPPTLTFHLCSSELCAQAKGAMDRTMIAKMGIANLGMIRPGGIWNALLIVIIASASCVRNKLNLEIKKI